MRKQRTIAWRASFVAGMAVLLASAAPARAATVQDDFKRPDTEAMSEHSPVNQIGLQYTVASGYWRISRGVLQREAETSSGILLLNGIRVESANGFDFSADAFVGGYADDSKTDTLRGTGLVFHYQDLRNYYEVRFRTNRNSDAVFQFVRVLDGQSATLASQFAPNTKINRAVYYTLRVRTDPDREDVFVYSISTREGEEILRHEVADRTFTAGLVGFRGTGDIVSRFDRFSLTATGE